MTEPTSLEPGLADLLRKECRATEAEVIRLDAIRQKHAQRKAATAPHPIFPTEPDAT